MTGALAGLRVLDLSRVLAGPYCAQLLGDFGAEVIKVEGPRGDDTRTWGPPYFPTGQSAYYTSINRNKRNLCLDLSDPRGIAVLETLIEAADVVVENFKTGTMARWGLDYETVLAPRHPSLIYCRITGYGTTGPLGGLPGYDAILQAYGGLMSVNGEPEDLPLRVGVPIVDIATGMFAFSGVLLALQERNRSGRGQLIDSTLLDSSIALLHPHTTNYFATGVVPPRTGSAHPTIAPYDLFTVAGKPAFIAAANNPQFLALVEALGRPDLAKDPRFAENRDRVENVAQLRIVLGELLAERDDDFLNELLRRGVPATIVNDVAGALGSPQVLHRGMVVEQGDYRAAGVPIKLTLTPGEVRSIPDDLGEHSSEVLADQGFAAEEIGELIRAGVVRQS